MGQDTVEILVEATQLLENGRETSGTRITQHRFIN